MNAIVTIDYKLPEWSKVTLGRMKRYSKRIGVKLHVVQPLSYRSFFDRAPIFTNLIADYDRTALIDADCVISRKAPDIFEAHLSGKVWMVPDCEEGGKRNPVWTSEMIRMQTAFGPISWSDGYGNFGVTLVEPFHIAAFDGWRDIPGTHHDQANFNYRIRKLGFPLGDMSRVWNSMGITLGLLNEPPSCVKMAEGAHIAHIAGFEKWNRAEGIRILDSLMP